MRSLATQHLANSLLFSQLALISPAHLYTFLSRVQSIKISRFRADNEDDEDDDETGEDDDPDAPWWKSEDVYGEKLPSPSMSGSTAIIPVKGVITSGLPSIYRAIGFADTDEIAGWVREAALNGKAEQILLDVDSPGGMVSGTPELAAEVAAAAEAKPVIAHTKGQMDSAAYWVASQATALYCTPSADVGCIGVYQVNYDYSAMLKDMGVKAEMFKSGDLKGAGHPAVPLTKEQRAHIQSQIDMIGAQFRSAVKSKRSLVEDDSMRGQSFLGTEAAERNLVAGLRSFASLL